MKHWIALFVVFLLAFLPCGVRAQGTAGQIRGSVVDGSNKQPIRFATVEVRSATSNALITGALTTVEGVFRIDGVRPGRYNVRVSAVGYATVLRSGVALTAGSLDVQLGAIELATAALQIDTLTVTSQRQAIRLSPEKNTYTVHDMPATVGGTAIDVLHNVPSVEVDGDNNLSLRGNQNVVVQLNGRAVPMTGQELGNYLAQLPANMLERVEVIPNPSAKYDPEGMAGIINIVLKQNAELGLSGAASATGGTTGQLNTSGLLGYQKGPLTLLGNYSFLHDARDMEGFTNLSVLGDGSVPTSYQDQDITGDRIRVSHTFNASGEYKLNKHNSLTSNLILSKRDITSDNVILISRLNSSRSLMSVTNQLLDGTTSGHNADYRVGFKRTGKAELDGFVTEARYYNQRNVDSNLFTTQPAEIPGFVTDGLPDLLTNIPSLHGQTFTLQSDLSRHVGKHGKIEAGYKGNVRKLDSDLAVSNFSYSTNHYVLDPNHSSTFSYDERVHAVYSVLSQTVDKWDLQGGLRLERATTTFNLKNNSTTYDNSYSSFYPSALVAYNVDDGHQLKLSYSKRIRRPDADHMNPFTEYEDALDVSTGNPYLRPEYTHAFQLGYQVSGQHGSLQVTPFYRHTVDPERRIRSIDNTGLTTVTFVNVASANSYGSEFIGSLKLHRLSGFAGLTAFRQVTDGSNLTTDFSNNAFGWTARANATLTLTPRLDMQTLYNYRAPMTVEQGRISRQSMLNVAFRQKLRGDRLSVSLRANDIFKQSGSGFTSTDPRLLQVTQRRTFQQGLFLSVSYNFGQQPRLRDRTDPSDASQ